MSKYKLSMTEDSLLILEDEGLYFRGLEKHQLMIGKVVFFSETSCFYRSAILKSENIPIIGAYSYCHSPMPLDLKLGNYCSVGSAFKVMGGVHPYMAFTTNPIAYDEICFMWKDAQLIKNSRTLIKLKRNLRIGGDVWIGDDVLLSQKVSVGTGAVLGARANVTKDVPPYAIVGGNPAKIIKYRFEDKIIEKLLETSWTNYDIAPRYGIEYSQVS